MTTGQLPELFDWISFKAKPKKEGLHDSGYRFLEVKGHVQANGEKPQEYLLGSYCDHIAIGGQPGGFGPSPTSLGIDVEADGTQRIFARDGGRFKPERAPFYSDACFQVVHRAE